MKYENFQQAKNIVEQIDRHKETLENLSSRRVTVLINANEQTGRIMTIGADPSYEHEYTVYANEFVGRIRADLQQRIDNLHSMLETL